MTKVFVNLPTSDLDRAKAFYTALGCEISPQFTDENAACIVWSEDIYFMVLKREFFATFTDKPIADPNEVAQVSVAFSRTPVKRSTRSSRRAWPPAASSRSPCRTTASCTRATSTTPTATPSASST